MVNALIAPPQWRGSHRKACALKWLGLPTFSISRGKRTITVGKKDRGVADLEYSKAMSWDNRRNKRNDIMQMEPFHP